MYAITTVAVVDRIQLNRFKYHAKPCEDGMRITMAQPAGTLNIPRCECARKERGKFPKRYVSVTRMNVASCETPKAFRQNANGMRLRAEHILGDLYAPCNATKAATTFQIRFLLE